MANDMERNYAEQIMALRQERELRKAREEAKVIEENYRTYMEWRTEAEERGDEKDWHDADEAIVEVEKQWAALPINQQPQHPWLTEENAAYVWRCADLNTPVNNLKFEQAMVTAQRAGLDLSNHEQFKEAVTKYISPGVFDQSGRLIPGTGGPIVPVDYQPMPDRNEAYQLARNSKYGKDLKPEDFVKGEQKLRELKAKGHYGEK